MISQYKHLLSIERQLKIRCLHNEARIIGELCVNGPMPSLEIMKKTGRSISGHTNDLNKLVSLGIIASKADDSDGRVKMYYLCDHVRELLL